MQHAAPASPTSPNPPRAVSYQFSIRSIIAVMLFTAVTAAIVGPFARRMNAEQAVGIVGYLAAVLVLATGFVVINGRKRRQSERDAGEVRFIFSRRSKLWLPASFLVLAFLYSVAGAICIYSRGYLATVPLPTGQQPPPQLPAYFLWIQAWGGGFFLGTGLGLLLARTDRVQFRERGIIAGWHFVKWQQMSRLSWSWKQTRLHLWGVGTPHFDIAVPASQAAEVEEFLQQRIANRQQQS